MKHGIRLGGLALLGILLLRPAARPIDEDQIRGAMERGVQHLLSLQGNGRGWVHGSNEMGMTALAGLTLLECGRPPDDPAVRRAVDVIRRGSAGLADTYGLALAILLLDRNGDEEDNDLIQLFGLRLMAGQNAGGPWSYTCPLVGSVADVRRMHVRPKDGGKAADKKPAGDKDDDKSSGSRLPDNIEDQIGLIRQGGGQAIGAVGGGLGDHSNTQFAILGLWAARRHGLMVDKTLTRVERHFRNSQNGDGGWSYIPMNLPAGIGSTPAMTCAGLLGLAVGYGVANDAALRTKGTPTTGGRGGAAPSAGSGDKPARDPSKDPAVKAGLLFVGATIGKPSGKPFDRPKLPPGGQPNLPRDFAPGGPPVFGRVAPGAAPALASLEKGYYFLWSLERVAVAYGLDTIGGKDWYGWGAEILLLSQEVNGSWQGSYADGGADTCFALLFLRRANLAKDLTASLRGKVTDPGEVRLKTGGVGGDALQNKKPKQAIDLKERGKDGAPAAPVAKDKPGGSPPRDTAGGAPKSSRPNPPPATLPLDDAAVAEQIAADLVKAPPAKQPALLQKLRDGRGVAYTKALAEVIPQLTTSTARAQAREALAERLSRMTSDTLRDKFQDKDEEIRRAAALACATKEDKSFVPDLIGLLRDPEPIVVRAAHAALKALTSQDFGPAADASKAQRERAIAGWQDWWKKHGGK
jgi:hypothetical protein